MAFERGRIDGTPALPQLRPENVSVRDGEAMIEVALSADHYIELYFPALDGTVGPEWMSLAGDVLSNLTEMDDAAQRACAERWAGSQYPSSYYEGDLAYITLAGPDEALLHYGALGCNSEWDERFVRSDGQWVLVASA